MHKDQNGETGFLLSLMNKWVLQTGCGLSQHLVDPTSNNAEFCARAPTKTAKHAIPCPPFSPARHIRVNDLTTTIKHVLSATEFNQTHLHRIRRGPSLHVRTSIRFLSSNHNLATEFRTWEKQLQDYRVWRFWTEACLLFTLTFKELLDFFLFGDVNRQTTGVIDHQRIGAKTKQEFDGLLAALRSIVQWSASTAEENSNTFRINKHLGAFGSRLRMSFFPRYER